MAVKASNPAWFGIPQIITLYHRYSLTDQTPAHGGGNSNITDVNVSSNFGTPANPLIGQKPYQIGAAYGTEIREITVQQVQEGDAERQDQKLVGGEDQTVLVAWDRGSPRRLGGACNASPRTRTTCNTSSRRWWE